MLEKIPAALKDLRIILTTLVSIGAFFGLDGNQFVDYNLHLISAVAILLVLLLLAFKKVIESAHKRQSEELQVFRGEVSEFALETRQTFVRNSIAAMYHRYEGIDAMTNLKDRADFIALDKKRKELGVNSYTEDRANSLRLKYEKGTL